MELPHLKLILALVILVMAAIAGWIPFKKRLASQHYLEFPAGEALACGVFLGAALVHMLAEAINQFSQLGIHYPMALLITGLVFLLMLSLEHINRELYHNQGSTSHTVAILAAIMLSFHSFFEGAALGLTLNISVALMIFLAIILHKWAAGFALAIQLNRSTLTIKNGLLIFLIFVCMTPLGILIGDVVSIKLINYPMVQPIFNSLAAGTFLYLGTLHGLNRAVMIERCCNLKNFSFVIMGFTLMAVVAIWT